MINKKSATKRKVSIEKDLFISIYLSFFCILCIKY